MTQLSSSYVFKKNSFCFYINNKYYLNNFKEIHWLIISTIIQRLMTNYVYCFVVIKNINNACATTAKTSASFQGHRCCQWTIQGHSALRLQGQICHSFLLSSGLVSIRNLLFCWPHFTKFLKIWYIILENFYAFVYASNLLYRVHFTVKF